MTKRDTIKHSNSCLNKARDDEQMFILLARDPAAADTIDFWVHRRIELQLNSNNDPQIIEAKLCALEMEFTREKLRGEIRDARKAEIHKKQGAHPSNDGGEERILLGHISALHRALEYEEKDLKSESLDSPVPEKISEREKEARKGKDS